MTSVLLVDDHPIVLQGCRRVLVDMGVDTLFEAMSTVHGYRAFLRHKPDLVIVDLTLHGDDFGGLSLIRRIAASDTKTRILAFSMHNDPAIVARALHSGAHGYVLKDAMSSEFVIAFEKVAGGEPYLSQKLAVQVAIARATGNNPATASLKNRELQVLSLLAKGNNYDQIATKLGVSQKTVANATSIIRSKLQLRSLADLIRFAVHNDPDRLP